MIQMKFRLVVFPSLVLSQNEIYKHTRIFIKIYLKNKKQKTKNKNKKQKTKTKQKQKNKKNTFQT
jgi:hypothetical protein